MIILPDRKAPVGKFLMPMRRADWLTPSRAQPKSEFGDENKTRWVLRGRLHDGHLRWAGYFEDREDADAFLQAVLTGSIVHDRALWPLPKSPALPRLKAWLAAARHDLGLAQHLGDVAYAEQIARQTIPSLEREIARVEYVQSDWHPDWGLDLVYQFATGTEITGTAGSLQSWSVPSDFNAANNFIDVIGGGGAGGGEADNSFGGGAGGAGGGFGRKNNVSLTPGGSASYQLGNGGTGSSGNNGGGGQVSWFNGATSGAASVAANGGNGGLVDSNSNASPGSGSIGDLLRSGGYGGAGQVGSSSFRGGGGGGAAGPDANGNGGAGSGSGAGGAGNGGTNGGGGGGGLGNSGGAGTTYGSTGPGGGGGSGNSSNGSGGGNYGSGGGGGQTSSTTNRSGGAGRQGMAYVEYTPAVAAGFLIMF